MPANPHLARRSPVIVVWPGICRRAGTRADLARGGCMRQNEPSLSGMGAFDSNRARAAARRPNHRRWRRRSIGGIVLFVAGSVGLGAFGPLSSATPAMKYRLAPIDAGPIVSAVATAGTLKPLAAILVG